MALEDDFAKWKKQCMSKVDFSKKGSVDEDIAELVTFINSLDSYFTTSSCSGRIILIDGDTDCPDAQKQNCSWLYVTHQRCQAADVITSLGRSAGEALFKFEPFVLHVQCRRLEDAQLLHTAAVGSGFRNSGISVGKKGKIITAVRSTHCLEVPLSHRGQQLVTTDYIHFIAQLANQKMDENFRRITRFFRCLGGAVCPEEAACTGSAMKGQEVVYKRRRKRTQQIPRSARHCSPDTDLTEDEDGLDHVPDLFS